MFHFLTFFVTNFSSYIINAANLGAVRSFKMVLFVCFKFPFPVFIFFRLGFMHLTVYM